MKLKRQNGAWGSKFPIYWHGSSGFAYNPSLREWELYDMAEDGSIQDLRARVKHRGQAILWLVDNAKV